MPALRFTAIMLINGVNPYVLVSGARAAKLQKGWKKPMPVKVRINGKPKQAWKINMMPVGDGSFYLYLHEIVRKASATFVGDKVNVEVAFDETYKSGPAELPTWFSKALRSDKDVTKNWKELTPSRQKEVVRYLSNLKSEEARLRNLQKIMHVLSGKKLQFMGRGWVDGK